MYYPSKYNHLIEVELASGRKAWALSNLFFGAATFLNQATYEALAAGEQAGEMTAERMPDSSWQYLLERGYVWPDPNAEEEIIGGAADAVGNRDQLAAGLRGGHYGFITSLYCNLACPYCFQRLHADSCGYLTPRQVDLGLAAIAACEGRAGSLTGGEATLPKISITGGEPLLRSEANLSVLEYLLSRLDELKWPYSITTNGTELARFAEEHTPSPNCRNIQVTLDGPRAVHDARRAYRNGRPSFDDICHGLEAALSAGWQVTLRANLDMANVADLPELARFVQSRGWPGEARFFAYVSPVTDHGSLGGYDSPKDEADLLEALLAVVDEAPYVREVFDIRHFRGFDYVERMLVRKDPKYPVLFRCEAVMGMYIFDPHGDLHVCLEAVGDRTRRVGTYDPEWQIDEVEFARWTRRNVLRMPECRGCKVRFICAGGCTIESFLHGGEAVCMPFLREMDMAWRYYARAQPELFV